MEQHAWIPSTTIVGGPAHTVTGSHLSSPAGTSTGNAVVGAILDESSEPQEQQQQDMYSVPLFTNDDEQREKQQLSLNEMIDIDSDLRGITTGMGTLSMGGAIDGQVAPPWQQPLQQHNQQQQLPSLSWRNQDEIRRDLNLLNEEILRIPVEDKVAYLAAVERCPEEVFGGWRWDVLLEQRVFDAKRNAKNIVEYWKRRLALFGKDRCYLPMTLAGAMQDEVAGMATYAMHRISPVTDTAGRTVMVVTPSRRVRSLYTTKSQSRAFWYELEVLSQDPEARRCGTVMIANGSNINPSHFDSRFLKFGISSFDLFPVSVRAMHFFSMSVMTSHLFIPALKFLIGRRLRHRLIVHTGTVSSNMNDMRSYALPPDRLPEDFGGEVVVNMQAWIYERYAKEGLHPPGSDMEMEQNFEPSAKRIRQESSPDASDGSGHTMVSSSSSSGKPSHTQSQPEDRREPLHLTSTTGIHIEVTDEEAILVGRITGRKADPRMNIAVILKLRTPDMNNNDALAAAGFRYPLPTVNGRREKDTFDEEGVSLRQRKNQLNRRFRKLKPRYDKMIAQKLREQQQQEQLHLHERQPAKDEHKSSSVTERTNSQANSSQEDVPGNAPVLSHDMPILFAPSSSGEHAVDATIQDDAISDASNDSFLDRIGELPGLDGMEMRICME